MALAHPLGVGWQELAIFPNSGRYFIVPQFAIMATVVWSVTWKRHRVVAMVAIGAIVYTCFLTIPSEWGYAPLARTDFAKRVGEFAHIRSGAAMTFALNPTGWKMTLVKR